MSPSPTSSPTPAPNLDPTNSITGDLSSLPLLSTITHAPFSLQIPFILLGSRSRVPDQIYNHAERRTRPLHAILFVLRHACSKIMVEVWIPSSVAENQGDEDKRWKDVSEGKWVVRYGGGEDGDGKEGEGVLSRREKRLLEGDSWSFPVVLQRVHVEMHEREKVLEEFGVICGVLMRWFHFGGREGEVDRGLRVVWNDNCHIRIAIEPAGGRGGIERWGRDMVGRMLLLLAGFEREMLVVEGMSSISSFCYMSRFLEWRGIRELRKEKKELWRALGSSSDGEAEYDYEKERWIYDMQDGEHILDVLEPRGWWNEVDKVVNGGEHSIGDMVRKMGNFEERGGRLAVSFPIDDKKGEEEGRAHEDRRGDEYNEEQEVPSTPSKNPRKSTPEPPPLQPFPTIPCIILQSQRSSLNPEHISAHVDFVTRLVEYARTNSYPHVRLKVEGFRKTAADLQEDPRKSLERLLRLISVKESTMIYYKDALGTMEKMDEDGDTAREEGSVQQKDEEVARPKKTQFDPLLKDLEKQRERELGYVSVFIARYEEAGGFNATPKRKLHDLMTAEEQRGRAKKADALEASPKSQPGRGPRSHISSAVFKRNGMSEREDEEEGGQEDYEFGYEVGPRGLVPTPGRAAFSPGVMGERPDGRERESRTVSWLRRSRGGVDEVSGGRERLDEKEKGKGKAKVEG